MTTVARRTSETSVRVTLLGAGPSRIATTVPFLDHMLGTLARYAAIGLEVEAGGDLRHHVIEDVAIALGVAMRKASPPRAARYGHAVVPMDDALVECAIDVGGRPFYEGPLPSSLYEHFMRSFADNAGATLHLRVLRGRDRHHVVEAAFKALGLALRSAMAQGESVFSTKGTPVLEVT